MNWRTVERAKKRLGVIAEKDGMKGGWRWRMPLPQEREDRQKNAKAHTPRSVGLHGKVAVFGASELDDMNESDRPTPSSNVVVIEV
jgi:hypothetical protein